MEEVTHDDLYQYLSERLFDALEAFSEQEAEGIVNLLEYVDQGILNIHDELYLSENPDTRLIHIALIRLVHTVQQYDDVFSNRLFFGAPFLHTFRLWSQGVMDMITNLEPEPEGRLQAAPAA